MGLDLPAFLSARGGCFRGDQAWVWYRRPGLWTTALWGRPGADDVRAVTSIWRLALRPELDARFASVVDCSRLAAVDGEAFEVLLAFMRAHAADMRARLSRQALVRPDGLVGTVVSGFFAVLGYAPEVRVFTRVGEAYEWLLGPTAGEQVSREFEARLGTVEGPDALLHALRAQFATTPSGLDLASAARHLGTSSRSLQRALAAAGTSFRAELHAARVRAAQAQLTQTDHKIARVAAGVGYASAHHFARVFRQVTGTSPQEWRDAHRRMGG